METREIAAKKNQILNIAALIIFGFAAFYLYGIQVKNKAALTERKNLEMRRKELLLDIGGLAEKVNAYKQVFAKRSPSDVMTAVSAVAERSGVKIVSLRPAVEQKYPEYSKLPFYLEVTVSGYHVLGAFISQIESLSDIYVVETLSVRSSQQTDQKDILTATLTIGIIASSS